MTFCNYFLSSSFTLVRGLFAFSVDLLGGGYRTSDKPVTEADLVKQMSDGDDHAFDILYERYFDQLFGFVIKRVGTYSIAEDLVSTIFLKAFASRGRFSKGSFKAWVYCIANNTIIDHYRTHKSTVVFDSEIHDVTDSSHGVAEILDQKHLRNVIEGVFVKLDARSQSVLQLKYFSELSNEEIALSLNVSTNHVGVLIHRALQKCAKFMGNKAIV
ncbi:MAG: sigma-70 family RNA polymerase sigma factor [Patescibacteria group bacterium]